MTWLLEVGLSNLAVAALLALIAAMAGRCFKRPALTHALWLLVFLKLITPPLVPLPLGWLTPENVAKSKDPEAGPTVARLQPKNSKDAKMPVDSPELKTESSPAPTYLDGVPADGHDDEPQSTDQGSSPSHVDEPLRAESPTPATEAAPVASTPRLTIPWLPIAGCVWLLGSGVWFLLAAHRLSRFRRLLRHVHHGQTALQEQTQMLADKLGVPCPAVWVVPGKLSPMLWVQRGKARLLLPEDLVQRLDPEQRRCLIAHELAHWRRCDHWVRRLELVVLGLYWWCPLVWWARAELEQAEEECCDAWVVWAVPGADRAYALALVETVDFLSGARAVMPPIASGMGQVRQLRRRLTMILTNKAPRALTVGGALTVVALGAILLPLMPSLAQEPAKREAVPLQDPARAKQAKYAREAAAAQEAVLARQDDGRDAQAQDIQRQRQEIERAQADLEQMQARLEEMKAQLQLKARRLRELVQQMERSKQKDPAADQPPEKRQTRKEPGAKFTDPVGKPDGGGRFGGGGVGGPGGGDVNRRLDALERKLDDVLRELHNMRQQPRPKGPGPGGVSGLPTPEPGYVPPVANNIHPTTPVPSVTVPGVPRGANPPPVDFVPVNPIPRTDTVPAIPPQPKPGATPNGPRQS